MYFLNLFKVKGTFICFRAISCHLVRDESEARYITFNSSRSQLVIILSTELEARVQLACSGIEPMDPLDLSN
jgi:hypothetical protein